MSSTFTNRHKLNQKTIVPITVRNAAPHEFRGVLLNIAYGCGFSPTTLRPLVCEVLQKRQDASNWSEYPNINDEIQNLLDAAEWNRVYDVVEEIARALPNQVSMDSERFESELNDYFAREGIGWKLQGDKLESRGDEAHEEILRSANATLETAQLPVAQNEFREALHDLSKRPEPDITGAIQHSMAGLECVTRRVCKDEKATLGDVLKRHQDLIPKPLDAAVVKLWGFASEYGRHRSEAKVPSFEEAELVVGVAASVSTYLVKITPEA